MGSWAGSVHAITLFVDDVDRARTYYRNVFGLPVVFEDSDSAVFDFGGTSVNLLAAAAAEELIEPRAVAPRDTGSRFQLTITVDDVDSLCGQLSERGVTLLNGPVDRPWGLRTASFSDPDGHVWEIAAALDVT
jgi:catechol 2,3-dioxygenase-like lactoylglutathione lyase family enzyme